MSLLLQSPGSSTIKTFADLYAWQEGHKLVLQIYALTDSFPKSEQFGLVSQLRRAAVSITSNIAEGFRRRSWKEKLQFFAISMGSLTEIENQLLIAKDVRYLPSQGYDEVIAQLRRTDRILQGLVMSTRKNLAH